MLKNLEKKALEHNTSKLNILKELKIQPHQKIDTKEPDDFSSDNSEADVDIEYVK